MREFHEFIMEGCPIRESPGQTVSVSPKPIVAYYALHRLQLPRHPPCALSNLITNYLRNLRFEKQNVLYLLRISKNEDIERKCISLTLYAVVKVLGSNPSTAITRYFGFWLKRKSLADFLGSTTSLLTRLTCFLLRSTRFLQASTRRGKKKS